MKGRELAALRAVSGLTQGQLAQLSGVSQPNIAAYENGRRPLTDTMAARLRRQLRPRPSDVLASQREEILASLARHGAANPRVFGSVARGADTTESDLDLLVSPAPTMGLFALGELVAELREITGLDVDVVSDRGLLPSDHHILDEARPL